LIGSIAIDAMTRNAEQEVHAPDEVEVVVGADDFEELVLGLVEGHGCAS